MQRVVILECDLSKVLRGGKPLFRVNKASAVTALKKRPFASGHLGCDDALSSRIGMGNLNRVGNLSDIEALIQKVGLRDRAAFSALYDATSAKLFGVCLRVLNNRAEAEDALQDAFVKVWHKADRYGVTGHSPMTWLITLARNTAIDKLRARKQGSVDIDEVHDLSDAAPTPEAAAIASSEKMRLDACLDTLDPDRAAAVRSAYLDGDSYNDLAARFDVPLNTMRTWLRRSLLKLKDCLSG